jgi:hypothetical protein
MVCDGVSISNSPTSSTRGTSVRYGTNARIAVDAINTKTAVFTWAAGTLVDVCKSLYYKNECNNVAYVSKRIKDDLGFYSKL